MACDKVFDKHTTPPIELDGSSVMCRDGIWVLLRTKNDRSSHKWVLIRDYPFLANAPVEGCEKLESTIKVLREALVDLCDSQLSSRDRENAIARGLAALEATKEP